MQASSPQRVSGDPFRDLFNSDFAQPTPPLPIAPTPGHDPNLPGAHGLAGIVNGLFESLTGGSGGANMSGGVGALGDFDPFQYVESSLAKMQNGRGTSVEAGSGGGLGQAIGSIARLIGLGG